MPIVAPIGGHVLRKSIVEGAVRPGGGRRLSEVIDVFLPVLYFRPSQKAALAEAAPRGDLRHGGARGPRGQRPSRGLGHAPGFHPDRL